MTPKARGRWASKRRAEFHVVRTPGWIVTLRGVEVSPRRTAGTGMGKEAAIATARIYARAKQPSAVMIHGEDGRVRSTRRYGKAPC